MASQSLRFSILVGILLSLHLSAADAELYYPHSAGVSGTTHVDYYLRGEMDVAAEEGLWRAQQWQQGRQLTEETSSASEDEADVGVADYTPCANDKHDPKLCKHN